jgi:hypothetical protein
VVVSAAVERQDGLTVDQRQAGRADQRAQVADRFRGTRLAEPGAQRVGGEARGVQHVVRGPLGRGGDAAPGA